MTKPKVSHAAPRSSRTLDCVVVSRRGSATAPSSALPAHALSGARLHSILDLLVFGRRCRERRDQRLPYGVGGGGGPFLRQSAGRGLLHVEDIDRLRAE